MPAKSLENHEYLKLDKQLCFALYSALNRVTRLYRPELTAMGITYPQYIALLSLWEKSPQTVGELGIALDLDSGTLTPLLKRMERQGLITRQRDTKDQRRVLIALTSEGKALRARAIEMVEAMACNAVLPVPELIELRDRIQKFTATLDTAANDVTGHG